MSDNEKDDQNYDNARKQQNKAQRDRNGRIPPQFYPTAEERKARKRDARFIGGEVRELVNPLRELLDEPHGNDSSPLTGPETQESAGVKPGGDGGRRSKTASAKAATVGDGYRVAHERSREAGLRRRMTPTSDGVCTYPYPLTACTGRWPACPNESPSARQRDRREERIWRRRRDRETETAMLLSKPERCQESKVKTQSRGRIFLPRLAVPARSPPVGPSRVPTSASGSTVSSTVIGGNLFI